MFLKRHLFPILCSILLVAFTLYVILDTFVIARVYTVVNPTAASESTPIDGSSEEEAQNSQSSAASEQSDETESAGAENNSVFTNEAVFTNNSYSDENISITLTERREYNTEIYVADVIVSSPEYLKTAFAKNEYGRNITQKTSAIAKGCGAILAINGDYYGAHSNGYVIRNGVLYRESSSSNQEDLVIWADGSFTTITEGETAAGELLANSAKQVMSFGPALITDGSIVITENEEVAKAKTSNPRTAIGIIDDCHYLFVVSDGRTAESEGLSLYQLAELMHSLDADVAYNLDGGGSSTMYFNGAVVNNPTTTGKSIEERSVSDIVYIG